MYYVMMAIATPIGIPIALVVIYVRDRFRAARRRARHED